jgi:hypothetical protein
LREPSETKAFCGCNDDLPNVKELIIGKKYVYSKFCLEKLLDKLRKLDVDGRI